MERAKCSTNGMNSQIVPSTHQAFGRLSIVASGMFFCTGCILVSSDSIRLFLSASGPDKLEIDLIADIEVLEDRGTNYPRCR